MVAIRIQLVIPIVIGFVLNVAAEDSLARSTTVRLWQDLPSDVLIELNKHLPAEQRLAWYVDPGLDAALYPGTSMELNDQTLAEMLDAYAQHTGLQWQQHDRSLWVYQASEPDELDRLAQQLTSDDGQVRIAARNALWDLASPESLRVALRTLGHENTQIAHEALAGLHDFMQSSPDWGPTVQAAMTLFGDPDWPRNAIQPFLRYHLDIMAPWAALHIAVQDDAVVQSIATAIQRQQDDIGHHLVLALAAVCAQEAELALQAMEPWFEVGGGWQQRYISGRVRAALAYAGAGERPALEDLGQSIAQAIDKLASGDRRERRDGQGELEQALSALAEHGSAQSREQILALALNVEHPANARIAALQALQAQPHADMAEALISLHQSLEPGSDKEQPVLDVLRLIDHTTASEYVVQPLSAAIQGEVDILLSMDDARDQQRQERDIRRWLEDIAGQRGPLPIAVLTSVLHNPATPQALRREICVLLRDHRHVSMVEPLAETFVNDDWPDVRRAAGMALGHSRLPEAIALLRQALRDRRSPATRQTAVQSLAQTRDQESFNAMVAMIDQATSAEERVFIIQHLGLIRHPASAEFLVELLHNEERAAIDRQAAASALSLVPTNKSRNALVAIIRGDHDHRLQAQTMDALAPRSHAEVPLFAPILLELLESRPRPDILRMVVSNLRRCMVGLAPGHPMKQRIEAAIFALIADTDADNNARREALEAFQYSDDRAEVASRLETIQDQERNPIMRRFISRAIEELRQ